MKIQKQPGGTISWLGIISGQRLVRSRSTDYRRSPSRVTRTNDRGLIGHVNRDARESDPASLHVRSGLDSTLTTMRALTILVTCLLLLPGCAGRLQGEPPIPRDLYSGSITPASCAQANPEFMVTFRGIKAEWNDTLNLAQKTPIIGMAGPIADLQAIKRKMEALGVPACAVQVQRSMLTSMTVTIDVLIQAMTERDEAILAASFTQAIALSATAAVDIEALEQRPTQ